MPEPRVIFGAFDGSGRPLTPGDVYCSVLIGFGLIDLPAEYPGRAQVRSTQLDAEYDLREIGRRVAVANLKRRGYDLLVGQKVTALSGGSSYVYIYFDDPLSANDWVVFESHSYRRGPDRYNDQRWPDGKLVTSVENSVLTFEDGFTYEIGLTDPQIDMSYIFTERMISA